MVVCPSPSHPSHPSLRTYCVYKFVFIQLHRRSHVIYGNITEITSREIKYRFRLNHEPLVSQAYKSMVNQCRLDGAQSRAKSSIHKSQKNRDVSAHCTVLMREKVHVFLMLLPISLLVFTSLLLLSPQRMLDTDSEAMPNFHIENLIEKLDFRNAAKTFFGMSSRVKCFFGQNRTENLISARCRRDVR